MLNGLYRNMPVFLEDNFLILEHKVSFGFVPYPSSVLIYKNRPLGNQPLSSYPNIYIYILGYEPSYSLATRSDMTVGDYIYIGI